MARLGRSQPFAPKFRRPLLGAAQIIAAGVCIATWTVPAAALSTTVTLSPSAVVATWTVPAPTLSTPVTLSPAAVVATWTVPAPTLTTPVTIAPSAVIVNWTVPAASMTGGQTITADAAVATWTVPDPVFTIPITISAGSAIATWTLPSASVQVQTLGALDRTLGPWPRRSEMHPDGLVSASVWQLWFSALVVAINQANQTTLVGDGTPEGVVTANVGTIYLRRDGGTVTTLYVKTSGTGNSGWTAK